MYCNQYILSILNTDYILTYFCYYMQIWSILRISFHFSYYYFRNKDNHSTDLGCLFKGFHTYYKQTFFPFLLMAFSKVYAMLAKLRFCHSKQCITLERSKPTCQEFPNGYNRVSLAN